jgi:hypothetical protein
MKRDYFVIHLESFGCSLIREDKQGYSCYRHKENATRSGVPIADAEGHLSDPTICVICRTLKIPVPNEVAERGIFELDANNVPVAGTSIYKSNKNGDIIDQ